MGVTLWFAKVCYLWLFRGRCEKPCCTNKSTGERRKDFSATKADAFAETAEILEELEFRSHRAAYMNYTLSDKYEKAVLTFKILFTAVSGLSSSAIWNVCTQNSELFSKKWLYVTGLVLSGLAGGAVSFLKFCPDYLLPAFEKQCKSHNDAGAGWQEIEIRIRGFFAAKVKEGLSPETIEAFINEIAEQRKEVCKIARPTQWMHKYCEANPEIFEKRKNDLRKAVYRYRSISVVS